MNARLRSAGWFFAILSIAGVSGHVCGFLILLFSFVIGHSGTTGTEYLGYWDPKSAWDLSSWYGTPLGTLLGPIGYYSFLRRGSLATAWLTTMIGTVTGGCVGSFGGPPLAALTGCAAFFITCFIQSERIKDADA